MKRILVTGGTGTLGRHVVAGLAGAGHDVALLSRRGAPETPPVRWFTGDLRTGVGLAPALDGIDVVVHCATGRGDRKAAARLITAAAGAQRPHLIYISIVGIDRIPFTYYQAKLDVERMIIASGLGWTTLRATQFHSLIESGGRALAVSPFIAMPRGLRFQPIAASEVAGRLIELADDDPAGRVTDMGGPEIATAEDLVRAYARATGRRRTIVTAPVPGKVFAALKAGYNLTPEHAVGHQTFADYLAARFPQPSLSA